MIWYDMICYDMIWYDMYVYIIFYMICIYVYIYIHIIWYIWRLWKFIKPRLDSRAGVLALWFATRFHVRFYKARTFQRMPTLKDISKPTINEMLGDSRIAESFKIRKFMTAWGDFLIMACNEREKNHEGRWNWDFPPPQVLALLLILMYTVYINNLLHANFKVGDFT